MGCNGERRIAPQLKCCRAWGSCRTAGPSWQHLAPTTPPSTMDPHTGLCTFHATLYQMSAHHVAPPASHCTLYPDTRLHLPTSNCTMCLLHNFCEHFTLSPASPPSAMYFLPPFAQLQCNDSCVAHVSLRSSRLLKIPDCCKVHNNAGGERLIHTHFSCYITTSLE